MEGKFAAAGVPFARTDIYGTVRTRAYQKHFVEIADRDKRLKGVIGDDPDNAYRCADLNLAVFTEQYVKPRKYNQGHDKIISPAETKSNHEDGNAIDIPKAIAVGLRNQLAQFGPASMNHYLRDCATTGMELQWGGYFTPIDPVHFQVVPKP
jgi:hypothetical protein